MARKQKVKKIEGYEYGIKEILFLSWQKVYTVLVSANQSRKQSVPCFISQCVNGFLVFYISVTTLPLLIHLLTRAQDVVQPNGLHDMKGWFLLLLIIVVSKILSAKINVSDLFKIKMSASLSFNLILLGMIVGVHYLQEFKSEIKNWLREVKKYE